MSYPVDRQRAKVSEEKTFPRLPASLQKGKLGLGQGLQRGRPAGRQ